MRSCTRPIPGCALMHYCIPTCALVSDSYLDEYNMVSKAPMKLVMFKFACEHVSRVSRVLKQDNGHCLLAGIGGSGRQSAAKLATFMADYDLYQIEITKNYTTNDWREDLKKVSHLRVACLSADVLRIVNSLHSALVLCYLCPLVNTF